MKKILLLLSLISLLSATRASAQTSNAQWNQSETPAVANTFTYTLKVDALAPVTLTTTCVTAATGSSCSASFTLSAPAAVHTYVLTATNAFGSTSVTLGPGAPPNTSGFKVIIIQGGH